MKNLKLLKTLTTGVALALAIYPQAWAESGTCGENCTWTFSDGVLDISGSGQMEDYGDWTGNGYTMAPWENLNITSVNIGSQITSVGNNSFVNQSGLTSVNFGNNSMLQSIGDMAFSYTGLTNIDIPDSVTSIGNWAFTSCDNLSNIDIPDSVTEIGSGAFDSSNTVNFGANSQLTTLDLSSFYYGGSDIILPPNVTEVLYYGSPVQGPDGQGFYHEVGFMSNTYCPGGSN